MYVSASENVIDLVHNRDEYQQSSFDCFQIMQCAIFFCIMRPVTSRSSIVEIDLENHLVHINRGEYHQASFDGCQVMLNLRVPERTDPCTNARIDNKASSHHPGTQCWVNVGPPSMTSYDNGSISCVLWAEAEGMKSGRHIVFNDLSV